ncbi:MAG: hypothetical protein AB7E24_17935 [Novosphingobium sp.]
MIVRTVSDANASLSTQVESGAIVTGDYSFYETGMVRRSEFPGIAIFGDFDVNDIDETRARAAEAAKVAAETLDAMRAIMARVDQLELLSRLSFLMIAGIHAFGTPEFDPAIRPHELELLQALALSQPRSPLIDPAALPDLIERLLQLAKTHTNAVHQMSLTALREDTQHNRVEAILDRMRTTTYTVRGPRHAFQTRAYLRDFAAEMDDRFMASRGFAVSDLIGLIEDIMFRAGGGFEALRARSARWMGSHDPSSCLDFFLTDNPHLRDHPLLARIDSRQPTLAQVKGVLMALFEEQLRPLFKIGQPESDSRLSRLRNHLAALSLRFGDVSEEALSHLKLGNPVRSRPFLVTDDGDLYLFCTQTCLANLVELIDDLAAPDAGLKEACEAFKARWLECRLEKLVRNAFPSGTVFANAAWSDIDGKPGETDCVLVIDNTVALFEAKSGRITPPAKRGAKDRLKREITALLVEPSRQSARLAKLLRSTSEPVALTLVEGTRELQHSDIREIIRFNILFDTLGPLTAGTKRLVEAGFIAEGEPMAPSMSIFELETLIDVLPDQISRLHYLRRRMELERDAVFEADEMDLIAFYLECSFCIPHIEREKNGFGIYGWSDRVARLYDENGREGTVPIKLKRTPFWQRLLETLEAHGKPGWTRFGYHLSNVAYHDQWTVHKRRDQAAKRARRVKPGQAVQSGVYASGERNGTVIGLCVGKSVSPIGIVHHTHATAIEVSRQAASTECLVIYWDLADPAGEPSYIATFKPENLASSAVAMERRT